MVDTPPCISCSKRSTIAEGGKNHMLSPVEHPENESLREGRAEKPTDRNPYVLVVGCPRSGTTLLQRMLDSHPQLAVANDTHFIARVLQKTAPDLIDSIISGNDVPLTTDLIGGVSAYHRFPRLGLSASAVQTATAR